MIINKKKRILSIVTAIAVMFTMSSVSIFALDGDGEPADNQQVQTQGEEPTEGTQGEDLSEGTQGEDVSVEALGENSVTKQGTIGLELSATGGNGTVTLNWEEAVGWTPADDQKYAISYTDENGVAKKIEDITENEKTITGLTNLREYTFTVSTIIPVDDGEGLPYSKDVTACPGQLTLYAYAGYKSVTLRWNVADGKTNASDYIVEGRYKRYYNGKFYSMSDFEPISGASYVDGRMVLKTSAKAKSITYNKINTYKYEYRVKLKNFDNTESEIVSEIPITQAYITITTKMSKRLTSHNSKKRNVTTTFRSGTRINTIGYGSGKYQFYDNEGNLFYITRISTRNASGHYINTKKTSSNYKKWYSSFEAENFVNEKKLKSGTEKLIWVSEYYQHAYIFEKKGSKWECIKNWNISTGKPSAPSPTGKKKIIKKISYRHGIPYWSCYSSLNALHAVKSDWGTRLGSMQSSGCIRNTNATAKWIYKYCGKGTGVLVY